MAVQPTPKLSPNDSAEQKITEAAKSRKPYYVTTREAAHIRVIAGRADDGTATHRKIREACGLAYLKDGTNVADPSKPKAPPKPPRAANTPKDPTKKTKSPTKTAPNMAASAKKEKQKKKNKPPGSAKHAGDTKSHTLAKHPPPANIKLQLAKMVHIIDAVATGHPCSPLIVERTEAERSITAISRASPRVEQLVDLRNYLQSVASAAGDLLTVSSFDYAQLLGRFPLIGLFEGTFVTK